MLSIFFREFPIQHYPIEIDFIDILIIQIIVLFFGAVSSLIVSKNHQFYGTNLNDNNSLKQTLNKNYFYEAPHPIPEKNQFDGWSKLLSINSPNKSEKVNSIYVKDRQNNYGTVCSSIIGLPKIKTNTKGIFWLYRKSSDALTDFKKLKLFI